jgi:recombination protein U
MVLDMKYPYGAKKLHKSNYTYANRGMTLENEIGDSNKYYRDNDIAIIYKKPTPITISKVDYPSRLQAVIREGYFKTPSTTDYNGIYKGKYIDFEAKETKNKTSFPLSNIHMHQIEHLKSIYNHGGIGFLIVRFTSLNRTYLLTINKLRSFIENYDKKSIPLSYFDENAYIIKDKYQPKVDYLKIVDEIYFKNII